ncbi:MAG: DUF2254 domain-containing protein [Gemmatimonadaceae bacterium]
MPMKLKLLRIRDSLRDSFWFLPLTMALLAAAGALASVALDRVIGTEWVQNIGWVWNGGPDGARSVLSTVAGSLMTVISIVFSLTITTLAQTSSHYGPRVLRNFTSNRGVQFTLGTFIATFVFCLLVLRTVRSVQESPFVPYLSVNIGVLMTLVSLTVLIFFIHHIAQSIQAENLTADVGQAIIASLPELFPEQAEREAPRADVTNIEWKDAFQLTAQSTGYVQHVDIEGIVRLATECATVVRLHVRAGDFVWKGAPLIAVLNRERLSDETAERLVECFSTGHRRTPDEDIAYSVQQLVEIGAHGLSPGINEPFTALNSIDWLGAALAAVATREFPRVARYDDKGELRVIARVLAFPELVHTAFDQIRMYGSSNADVLLRMLEAIVGIAPRVSCAADIKALAAQAELIATDSSNIVNAHDRQRVLERHQEAQALFATLI